MDRIVTSSAPARLLTTEERRQWDEDGYLHIRNALPPGTVASLLPALSALHERFTEGLGKAEYWADVFDAGNDRDLSIANAITWCPGIAELLDHPGVFGKVLGLMAPTCRFSVLRSSTGTRSRRRWWTFTPTLARRSGLLPLPGTSPFSSRRSSS